MVAGGAIIAVARDGTLEAQVGAADEAQVGAAADAGDREPLAPDSIFYVGSIAKQFVATCVALLEHDRALDLDDPVARFVPGLPAWGEQVTVRHLVHHTGGVRERRREGPGVPVTGVPALGNADVLDTVRGIAQLDFKPGSRYGYSNRGYLLLAEVVGAVNGAPLRAFAHERIFEPLGMTDSFFRDEEAPLPERATRGHFEAHNGQTYVEPARFHAVGAGGLWTTAADLARWSANFDDDRLTDGWLPGRLTTPGTLVDGTEIHYAWGLSVRSHRGVSIVSHGGNFPGWESKMVRFPTEGLTVIVLANREDLGVSTIAFDLADDLLGEHLDPDAPHADQTFDGTIG